MRRPLALCGVLVLLASGLVLASCGAGDEDATDAPTAATSSQTVTATLTETTTETAPPPPPGPTVFRIAVVGGVPEGGIVRETVDQGDRVVLVVTSDVADHVHLHGYDVFRDVAPGKPARLPFRATIPGRFEVELEDHGVPIADVTVSP